METPFVEQHEVDAALIDEVRTGLQQTPKRLSSRFFYDAEGSRIFAEIMHTPDYYLTRSEYEILDTQKADLLRLFTPDKRPVRTGRTGRGRWPEDENTARFPGRPAR